MAAAFPDTSIHLPNHLRVVARLRSMCLLAAIALLLPGCRSTTSRDLVERELRQQEDQIYAMEDYLADYQQLLCQYRRENASLKRQLVQGQFKDGPVEQPGRGSTSPSLREDAPPRFRDTEPPADSDSPSQVVPPLDFNTPEIPPLDDTTSTNNEPHEEDDAAPLVADRNSASSTYSESVELANALTERAGPVPVAGPPEQVAVRGEVILDDPEIGPRVWVEVTPILTSGTPTTFDGRLSLMILDMPASGAEKDIARWDFTRDDLAQVATESGGGATLQFPLQLPADVPADRPVELWVRLMPEGGRKVLAHAPLDLSRPSRFASVVSRPRPVVDRAVRTAAAELAIRSIPKPSAEDDGWTIARPDQPNLTTRLGGTSDGNWRAATHPVPVVESRPVVDIPLVSSAHVPQRSSSESGNQSRTATSSTWSPERPPKTPPDDHIRPPAVPVWAPTR